MPRHDMSQEQIEAETERFAAELAKAFLRDLRTAAQNAPYGKIVSLAEAVAVTNGRELVRQTFEAVIQEQADIIEKKRNQAMPLWRRTRPPRILHKNNSKCRR